MPTRNPDNPAPPRALIIDPTPSNVEVLSTILTGEGYEVLRADNGEAGVRLAMECNPHLVLLDLQSSKMKGMEVLDTLKREQPETVVIFTAPVGSEETAIQAMRQGMNDYVIKKRPYDPEEVRKVVGRAHNEAHLRRENARLQRELTLANQQLREYSAALERTLEEARNANEQLKELDQTKASFFSMISHELRHPLSVAKGYLELIEAAEAPLGADTRKYLAIADQNLQNLDKMLDDLLDLSRMEAGRYHVDRQAERVATLVGQTILALGATAGAKEIKLLDDLPNALPLVSADPLRIAQVLANLVDNAIKFTPRGGSIRFSARELPSEVEITVSDTGIGIASPELEKIFERFYQIENPASPHNEGAGLGLAISREIIRLHGGQIWATSEPGRGSQLHFTLPKVKEAVSA